MRTAQSHTVAATAQAGTAGSRAAAHSLSTVLSWHTEPWDILLTPTFRQLRGPVAGGPVDKHRQHMAAGGGAYLIAIPHHIDPQRPVRPQQPQEAIDTINRYHIQDRDDLGLYSRLRKVREMMPDQMHRKGD